MKEKESKKKFVAKHLFLSIVEIIITIGSAILFYFNGKEDLGLILGMVGAYLVINRIILHQMIKDVFAKTEGAIFQIARMTDIRHKSSVDLITKTLDSYQR